MSVLMEKDTELNKETPAVKVDPAKMAVLEEMVKAGGRIVNFILKLDLVV